MDGLAAIEKHNFNLIDQNCPLLRQIGNILDGPEEPWQQRFLHIYNALNHQ